MSYNRLRWTNHVLRRLEHATVFRMTIDSDYMNSKRSRGRPKNSWIGCVEKEAKILNIPNWQKDKPQTRSLVRKK